LDRTKKPLSPIKSGKETGAALVAQVKAAIGSKKTHPTKDVHLNTQALIADTWILGWDEGERYAGGFCARKVGGKGNRRNLTISSGVLKQPLIKFQAWLKSRKGKFDAGKDDAAKLAALERQMEQGPHESMTDYMNRYKVLYGTLSSFYNSRALKKARWDLQRASQGKHGYNSSLTFA
jgi:hypothetical protein